jgi:hypothetical protein
VKHHQNEEYCEGEGPQGDGRSNIDFIFAEMHPQREKSLGRSTQKFLGDQQRSVPAHGKRKISQAGKGSCITAAHFLVDNLITPRGDSTYAIVVLQGSN